MYIFMAKSQVDISDIDYFEEDQKQRSKSLLAAPGFVQRLVLKDNDNPGTYFYISGWESIESHRGFKADPDVKAWERSLAARKVGFTELERFDCSVVVDDRPERPR